MRADAAGAVRQGRTGRRYWPTRAATSNTKTSTAPARTRSVLSKLLGRAGSVDRRRLRPDGPADAIRDLKDGEILLLDNVRYVSEEQTLFEIKLQLTHEQQAQYAGLWKSSRRWAICMFATPSPPRTATSRRLCGFEQVLPSAMGRLFETRILRHLRADGNAWPSRARSCWAARRSPTRL